MGEDFEEEGISLTTGVMKSAEGMVERKERRNSSTADLYGLGEDLEEDKRE